MYSKVDFELVYEVESINYTFTVSEFNYSFEFMQSELKKQGMESELDAGCLRFNEFTEFAELNKYLETNLYQDFFETYYNSYLDVQVFIAGLEIGIAIENIEDSYQGAYNSDGEFTEHITNELYNLKDIPNYLVIDWEASSRDLMYDFSENNGYYFSNY
jgi:hypothetical protein